MPMLKREILTAQEAAAEPGQEILDLGQGDPYFAREIAVRSGTDLKRCYLCRTCSGGCPVYRAMDLGPHRVMRLVLYGQRRRVLESNTIWLCVGCHTCAAVCPMAIDIAAVMDTLRQLALEEGVEISEPGILDFHREVLRSIQRHGRTHKLEIMMRYKVGQHKWFEDMDLGLRMLAKRKLDLRPSRIQDPSRLAKLFGKPWEA